MRFDMLTKLFHAIYFESKVNQIFLDLDGTRVWKICDFYELVTIGRF